MAHKPIPKTATNPMNSRKLTIFGGKGGVGNSIFVLLWYNYTFVVLCSTLFLFASFNDHFRCIDTIYITFSYITLDFDFDFNDFWLLTPVIHFLQNLY